MSNENNFLNIKELIDLCDFQRLQDKLAYPLEISIIAVDYTGKTLTKHSCCSEFCNLVRSIPKYKKLCEKCDSYGGLEAARSKHTYIYACHMGIIDFAIPIFYKDYYLGAIMCGQLLLDKPYKNYNIKTIINDDSTSEIKSFDKKNFYNNLNVISYEKLKDFSEMISYISNFAFSTAINLQNRISTSTVSDIIEKELLSSFSGISSDSTAIDPALRYINSNYSKSMNAEFLASLCNISSSYFSKLFRKLMNMGITEYINKVRIKAAKSLLLTTNLTIISIAFECGFEDSGYFIKVFKKFTNLTPNQFRAKNSKLK